MTRREAWGAGGGGGNTGGGGALVSALVDVTPDAELTVVVGAGGAIGYQRSLCACPPEDVGAAGGGRHGFTGVAGGGLAILSAP